MTDFCAVILSMLVLAAEPAVPSKHRLIVSKAEVGTLVWHGHLLSPPYEFGVDYTLSPDTVWGAVTINGYPMHPRRPPQPSNTPRNPRSEQRRALLTTLRLQPETQGVSRDSSLRAMIRRLEEAKSLVDSARIETPYEIRLYWKGDTRPSFLSFAHFGTCQRL